MKIDIALSDKNRKSAVEILNRLLSDEYVLYTKTRNYHWNVTGPDFSELHKFFEAQYEELDNLIDEVALSGPAPWAENPSARSRNSWRTRGSKKPPVFIRARRK